MLKKISIFGLLILLSLVTAGTRPASAQELLSHVEAAQTGTDFVYTLFNDEVVGSSNYIALFQILVNAPITVTGTPNGWSFDTDGSTFVSWFNTDTELPYPNDIAPTSSLGGFQISSTTDTSELQPYSVLSWDHTADSSGPSVTGGVIAPSASLAAAPEPCTAALLLLSGAGLPIIRRRKRFTR